MSRLRMGSAADRQHERRQIGWAATAIVFGGAPHLFSVAPWVALVVLAIALWRIAAADRGWSLPSIWVRFPVTVLGLVAVLFTYRSVSGIEAGSALLLVMAAMKLLETRSERDRVLVVFIGYFLLFAVFLREQAVWSIGWFALGTVGITAALAQTVRRGPLLAPTAAAVGAGRLLLQGLPLAVLLFVLFPRIPGPFWAIPNRAMSGVTGLAETISPGDISALSLSDEVVFRARFESGVPRTEQLYWRGPVLERFDGRTWSAASRPARARALPRKQTQGPVFGYQLVLEPQGKPWLLALESPLSWSMPHAYLSPALQLLSPSPLQERVSYRARSQAGGRGASEADAATLETNLRLPPGVNPRSIEFAARLRATTGDDGDYVREILRRFGTDGFRYTLEPPPLGTHPVDQFLFDARAGFCEHYASAMALLLRAGGIPARVVVGYQGGERNPFGDYWIVRQANAHAWVEAWLQGAWQRLDPTASVAPERIERGYAADTGSTLRVGIPLWRHDYLARAVLSWDALNAAWDRWVLAYGPEAQDELLLALGFEVPRSTQLAGLAAGASAICLLLMAYALRHHRSRRSDPALRCYERFTATLAPVVRPRRPAESAQHYARSVCALRPDLAREVTHITDLYLRIRYGGHDDPHSRRELVRAIRRFRPPPRPAPA